MQTLRHIRQTILAAALLFAASSCSDIAETAIGTGGISSDPAYANRACYFVFEIDTGKDDPQTRATTYDDEDSDQAADGDLVYGTEDEHKIGRNGNYAFFFNESGILQAITGLSLSTDGHDLKPESEKPTDETTGDGSANGGSDDGETEEDDENEKRRKENQYSDKVEARYTTLLRSTEKNFPEEGWRVLVVLNGQGLYNELTNKFIVGTSTEEQVQNYVWTETADPNKIGFVEVDEEGKKERRFVMTNSVYVNNEDILAYDDRVLVKKGDVLAAVPITWKMIHEVNDENDPIPPELVFEDEGEILKIRVERMVSKFTLDFDYETSDDYLEDGEFKEIVDVSSGEKKMIYKPAETKKLDQNHQVVLCTGWEYKTSTYTYKDYVKEGDSYELRDITITTEDWEPILKSQRWQAEILGWGMNALETQSNLFKSIQADGDYFSGWDNSSYYRTYWSEDPHYKGKYYPWQYRGAVDKKLNWYGNEKGTNVHTGKRWENILMNYAWNDPHLNWRSKDENGENIVLYIPENTYDSNEMQSSVTIDEENTYYLDNRTDLLAGTHLIIPARLWVQDENENKNYDETNDVYDNQLGDNYKIFNSLYRDRAGVCYTSARDCLWGLVRAINYALSTQTMMRYYYYNWDSNIGTNDRNLLYAVPTITYDESTKNANDTHKPYYYKLYYQNEELTYEKIMDKQFLSDKDCEDLLAIAYVKDGDGKRLLNTKLFSIKKENPNATSDNDKYIELPIYSNYKFGYYEVLDEETGKYAWYTYDNSDYLKSRTADEKINDVQSLIYEWVGAVDYFKDGMMYYPHPVKIKENVYGTVRNAWYKFNIVGINNVGIPVHDAFQQIVPNWDELGDQMTVKVNIIGWHTITGTVPILP